MIEVANSKYFSALRAGLKTAEELSHALQCQLAAAESRATAAEKERDRLREALEATRHWHEQLDYDEALNVIDAALAQGREDMKRAKDLSWATSAKGAE